MGYNYFIRGRTYALLYFLLFISLAFAQKKDSVDYFPLNVGDNFIFMDSRFCPPQFMVPDVGYRMTFSVKDSMFLLNKVYYRSYLADLSVNLDTIRIDSLKNLIIYKNGKERIFYKLVTEIGDSWEYNDGWGGMEFKYKVTLESKTGIVNVQAGYFTNCLKYYFKCYNSPECDFTDWLAPNVGLVFRCKWTSMGLYEANIGKKHFPLTSIQDKNILPEKVFLYPNYPNPFNPATVIKYEIDKNSMVRLDILDLSGRLIKSLVNENKLAGIYETRWDGTGTSGERVSTGLYFYKLSTDYSNITKKLLLIK